MKIKFEINGIETDGYGDKDLCIPKLENLKHFKHVDKKMVSGTLRLRERDTVKWASGHRITVPHSGVYSLAFEELK